MSSLYSLTSSNGGSPSRVAFVPEQLSSAVGKEEDLPISFKKADFTSPHSPTLTSRAESLNYANVPSFSRLTQITSPSDAVEQDKALETIWQHIQSRIEFEGAPIPNNAQDIRQWFDNPLNAEKIATVTELDLSHLHLTVLPSEIGKLTHLKWLNLQYNRLISLPEEIGNLISLREIVAYGNQLQSLPSSIGNLVELRKLYLQNNYLTVLPKEIGQLYYLNHLSLQGNYLQSLPSTIGQLPCLDYLSLRHNYLSTLPTEMTNLRHLHVLDIVDSGITRLPEGVSAACLYVVDDHVTGIPEGVDARYMDRDSQ